MGGLIYNRSPRAFSSEPRGVATPRHIFGHLLREGKDLAPEASATMNIHAF